MICGLRESLLTGFGAPAALLKPLKKLPHLTHCKFQEIGEGPPQRGDKLAVPMKRQWRSQMAMKPPNSWPLRFWKNLGPVLPSKDCAKHCVTSVSGAFAAALGQALKRTRLGLRTGNLRFWPSWPMG